LDSVKSATWRISDRFTSHSGQSFPLI